VAALIFHTLLGYIPAPEGLSPASRREQLWFHTPMHEGVCKA